MQHPIEIEKQNTHGKLLGLLAAQDGFDHLGGDLLVPRAALDGLPQHPYVVRVGIKAWLPNELIDASGLGHAPPCGGRRTESHY